MYKFQYKLMILLTFLLLTGCWDAKNLELMYYIHSLGFDYKDGQFEIYAQIINFQAMATGGEGTQAGGSLSFVGYGKGETAVEALHELYSHTDRRILWGHVSSIVMTQRALQQEDGILKMHDLLSRYDENRHTVWIFGTTDSPAEILTTPLVLNISPIFSFLGEPSESYDQSSLVEPIRLHRLLSLMYEPGQTTIFPILDTVDSMWFEDEEKLLKSLKIVGAGFLEGETFQGFLLGDDIKGMPWMNESTVRKALVLKPDGEPIGTVIIRDPKVNITPKVQADQVTFDVEVELIANPVELFDDITVPEVQKQVAHLIEEDIRYTYQKGVEKDIDVYQLSHTLYKKSPNLWRESIVDGKLPLTPDSLGEVKVNVKVVKTGKDKFKTVK
ncbi:hypothetical protein BTR23_13430 [Alkalihalophilus pseudofirmus]|nr:hypothetical protein BTR23_13430 [Alkalihalophilus pseudofirmus]